MSKFTEAAAVSQSLSLTAMEEASRLGQRTADIEHLLLALTLNEQVAGQVLRSQGITLDTTRQAVADQHAEQLASLGIETDVPLPGKIVFHETGGYEWSERALTIFTSANKSNLQGDAAALLRELVIEPSGMIEAVLHRLGSSPSTVLSALTEAERFTRNSPHRQVSPSNLSGGLERFIPAPMEQVWKLLADPNRMPEWDQNIGYIEDATSTAVVGDSWIAHVPTHYPDGKASKVKPQFATLRVHLHTRQEESAVEWRFTYPDMPNANARRLRFTLEPAAGGTQLQIFLAWERNAGRRRRPLLSYLFRPLYRFSIWMQLSVLGAGVSRAFR